ncbi:MAG: hypothetical protein WCF85_20755 [Rhodospirillaceae bacterium]
MNGFRAFGPVIGLMVGLMVGLVMSGVVGIPGPAVAERCCAVMPKIPPDDPAGPDPSLLVVPISPQAAPKIVPPVVLPPPQVVAGTVKSLGVYTVKQGARLLTVAKRTKTKFSDLILLNPGLDAVHSLAPGTRVLLPIPGSW